MNTFFLSAPQNEEDSNCLIHVSQNSMNLLGDPSLNVLKSILDTNLKFYLQSKLPETEKFYPIVPRQIEIQNISQNQRIDFRKQIEKRIMSREEKLFEKLCQLSTEGKIFGQFKSTNFELKYQCPHFALFKVMDEETFRTFYMMIPEAIQVTNDEEDLDHYLFRLRQWMELGSHPNIHIAFASVKIFDGKTYPLCEIVDTVTLRDWMFDGEGFLYEDYPVVSTKKILNVLIQLATGMTHLHAKGLTHQWLRPELIFIDKQKNVKISGLFFFSSRKYQIMNTKAAFAGGSPEYWSPEQGAIFEIIKSQVTERKYYTNTVNSLPHMTNKIDVYSFGLILWEILEGKKQWTRGDKIDFLLKPFYQPEYDVGLDKKSPCYFKILPKVFKHLRLLALSCLNPQQSDRPEFATIVDNLLEIYNYTFDQGDEELWQDFFDPNENADEIENNIAIGLLSHKDHKDSIRYWDKILARSPEHLLSIYNSGLVKLILNENNDLDILRMLHYCPESPLRNYFLTLVYLRAGKTKVLSSPYLTNFNSLPERCMKDKMEAIYVDAMLMAKKFKDDFRFSMIPKTKIYTMNSYDNYLVYLTNQESIYLCVCDFTDFNQKRVVYKEIEGLDKSIGSPSCIAISPDKSLIAFSIEGTIELYSVNLHNSIFVQSQTYKGHLSKVTVLRFDPSSQKLASGGADNSVRIWGVSEGLLQIYRGHKSPIYDVHFTEIDDYVVSTGEDCMIIFWNYITLEETIVVQSQNGVPKHIAFDLEIGLMLSTSIQQHSLQLWDLNAKKVVARLEGHTALCNGVKIAKKKRLGLSYANDGTLRLWSLRNGNCLSVYGVYRPILLAQFNLEEEKIFYVDEELKIREQNIFVSYRENGSEFEKYVKPNEIMTNYMYTKQRQDSYKDAFEKIYNIIIKIRNWDVGNSTVSLLFKTIEEVKSKNDLNYGPEVVKLLIKVQEHQMAMGLLTKVSGFTEDYIIPRRLSEKTPFAIGCLSKTRNYFAFGDLEGRVLVYNMVLRKLHREIKTPLGKLAFLGFSYNDAFLMECNEQDNSFRIWDVEKASVCFEMISHDNSVGCAELTPNNEYLMTGGNDSQMIICNVLNSEITAKRCYIKKHHVFTSIITVDKRTAISASTDHVIRIWDIQKKSRIKVLSGHSDIVVQLFCEPNGKYLLSGSLDNTLRMWNLETYHCESIIKLPFRYLKKMDIVDYNKYALLLFENATLCIMNLATEEVKWTFQFNEEVISAYWFRYPSKIIVQTAMYVKVLVLLWN